MSPDQERLLQLTPFQLRVLNASSFGAAIKILRENPAEILKSSLPTEQHHLLPSLPARTQVDVIILLAGIAPEITDEAREQFRREGSIYPPVGDSITPVSYYNIEQGVNLPKYRTGFVEAFCRSLGLREPFRDILFAKLAHECLVQDFGIRGSSTAINALRRYHRMQPAAPESLEPIK